MDRGYIDDDHRKSSSSGQVRSYVCDFCRRGFASAQALGGHMNIHRKDRAKLRQSICEDDEISLSLDIKSVNTDPLVRNPHHQPHMSDEIFSYLSQFGEDSTCVSSRNKPEGSSRLVELPFFFNITSVKDEMVDQTEDQEQGGSSLAHKDDEEKKVRLAMEGSSSSSSQTEVLDLELRLGLDPHKDSSSRRTIQS